MPRQVNVAAVSPTVKVGDTAGNVVRVAEALAQASAEGARLVVAPELALSGYVFHSAEEAHAAAITHSDPVWEELALSLAPGVVAVVGYAERAGQVLYNSAAVFTRDGPIGTYRKSHLWGNEDEFFATGDSAGALFDTPVGVLAVAICYDNEFPEVPRRLALRGAELLALPVNWPRVPRPDAEHPPETVQAMAAARSSRLATVIADRHGSERGVEWTGGTAVISDQGWVIAADAQGARAALTLDEGKAAGPHNDLFGDRRPALY